MTSKKPASNFQKNSPFSRSNQHEVKLQTILSEAARLFNFQGTRATTLVSSHPSRSEMKPPSSFPPKAAMVIPNKTSSALGQSRLPTIPTSERTTMETRSKETMIVGKLTFGTSLRFGSSPRR